MWRLNDDALHQGRYRPATAARLVGLPAATVRRWLSTSPSHLNGIVQRHGGTGRGDVSFLDLIELVMVRELVRESGLSHGKLRAMLAEAGRVTGLDHPLARRRFLQDCDSFFVGLGAGGEPPYLELGRDGQLALEEIVRQRAKVVDFEGEYAVRFRPMGRAKAVVIDVAHAWGAPTVRGTRISTQSLGATVRAENGDFAKVASIFGLDESAVHEAVEYEGLIAA